VSPGEQSALLLPVPAAEPAVGPHRARLDAAARDGVPAHLTVLYPFLPPDQVDDVVLGALGHLFAGFPAFAFTLDRVAWFGEQVVWLAPRDPDPFRAIMVATWAAYPDCPPYGNRHTEVIPHLTIGDQGTPADRRAAGDAVTPLLPVEAVATEVALMAGPEPGDPGMAPGSWRTLKTFPLAS
jgi:2'-5' RNA ligase superfamily